MPAVLAFIAILVGLVALLRALMRWVSGVLPGQESDPDDDLEPARRMLGGSGFDFQ